MDGMYNVVHSVFRPTLHPEGLRTQSPARAISSATLLPPRLDFPAPNGRLLGATVVVTTFIARRTLIVITLRQESSASSVHTRTVTSVGVGLPACVAFATLVTSLPDGGVAVAVITVDLAFVPTALNAAAGVDPLIDDAHFG